MFNPKKITIVLICNDSLIFNVRINLKKFNKKFIAQMFTVSKSMWKESTKVTVQIIIIIILFIDN